MKNNKLNSLAYVLVGSLLLGSLSVSAMNNEMNEEKAKEIALTQVNEEVKNVEVEYDKEDQKYEVEINTKTEEIEVDVETTGKIVKVEKEVEKVKKTNIVETTITKEKAKEIAFNHAGVKESEVSRLEVEYDKEDQKYEVDFNVGNSEYDYEIDAKTGKILDVDLEVEKVKETNKAETTITKEKAKEIAFNHAGVKESEVSRLEVEYDKEDQKYEVDFNVGNIEYDYEIDAKTGKILDVEKEVEKVKETKQAETITKDKAKEIAFNHANVKESEVRDLEVEFDDGKYEISFDVNGYEYEYEISKDGKILDAEKELND